MRRWSLHIYKGNQ